MAQLLKANKPTSLTCIHNLDHEMEWDSEEYLYKVDMSDKYINFLDRSGYRMHRMVPEILVWNKALDFETIYIARAEDFDEVEMF
jgi:hypothetical protein